MNDHQDFWPKIFEYFDDKFGKMLDDKFNGFIAYINDRFATKDDLKKFATKDDLRKFATKDDFNRLEKKVDRLEQKFDCSEKKFDRLLIITINIKEDLKNKYATKDDLSVVKDELLSHIDGLARNYDSLETERIMNIANLQRRGA